MNTSFSHALRVVICAACGGATHVAVKGGTQECEVCGETHELPPRGESGPSPSGVTDSERVERLRDDDPALPGVPEEVTALTNDSGVMLRSECAEDAVTLWQQTRITIREEPENARARACFFHLTMLLYRFMKAQKDDLRLRGVLESAVEATPGHRDHQIFLCVLSRAAARAGDLPAAEDWLSPCDEHADDIHSDGAYRYTAAYIATYKKQFSRVLALLGMRVGDTPLANNLDVICSLLRANAHENSNDIEAATLELADCMGRAPGGATEVEQVIRSSGDLVLCRKSFVRGRRLHDKLATGAGMKATVPKAVPSSSLKRAIPWVVPSLFFFGLAVMTDAATKFAGGQRLDVLFFVLAVSFAVPLAVLIVRRR